MLIKTDAIDIHSSIVLDFIFFTTRFGRVWVGGLRRLI